MALDSHNFVWAKIKAGKLKSPLRVEIKLKKDSFRIGEVVEGTVTIKNSYAASLPAVFTIRLYQEGKFFYEGITSIKSFPLASTKFTLQDLGVPHFNTSVGMEGKWKIVIIQQNVDESYAAQAEFSIVPPAIRQEKRYKFDKKKLKY